MSCTQGIQVWPADVRVCAHLARLNLIFDGRPHSAHGGVAILHHERAALLLLLGRLLLLLLNRQRAGRKPLTALLHAFCSWQRLLGGNLDTGMPGWSCTCLQCCLFVCLALQGGWCPGVRRSGHLAALVLVRCTWQHALAA